MNHPRTGVTGYGNDEKATARIDEKTHASELADRRATKGSFIMPDIGQEIEPEKITAVEALDRAFAACMTVGADTDSQLIQVTAHSCALAVFRLSRDLTVPPKTPYTAAHAARLREWHRREVERLDREAAVIAAEEMKKVGLE